ncbi:MAG: carboxypeptidase regulatory-like domain-containing protein [Candidatus Solibacter sp.]
MALLLMASPVFAAVTGTVTNQTTGKPQAGATVALYQLATSTGLALIDQAKSDAQGNFTINQNPQGPHLVRTAFEGVTYNHMLPPGQPSTGLAIDVWSASNQPGGAKVAKHMILFEPGGGQVAVTETYLFKNDGKTSWNDPDGGTLKFFLPAGASQPKVDATAPGGMPLGAAVVKTSKPDIMGVDFAIKPGDTRIDVSYTAPYTEGADLAGKIASKDENTYLIVPSGITIKGDGLNDLGAEPRSQAHIYGITGASYKVQLTGNVAPAPAEPSGGGEADSEEAGPKIEQIMPRVNTKAVSIVIVALGILALGFTLLYRSSPTPPPPSSRRGPNA